MNKSKFKLYIFIILFSSLLIGCSSGIENLTVAKKKVQDYYESGMYNTEVEKVIQNAEQKIEKLKLPSNPTVVFDVDETVLSSYEYAKELGFGYAWKSWNKWVLQSKAVAIKPVKKFYDYLVSKHIKIVFITGRTNEQYNATRLNLIKAGYKKFDTLVCRNINELKISTFKFKQNHRKLLTEKGFNIIASVGDQEADIEGKYTGIKIKIPNYIYMLN